MDTASDAASVQSDLEDARMASPLLRALDEEEDPITFRQRGHVAPWRPPVNRGFVPIRAIEQLESRVRPPPPSAPVPKPRNLVQADLGNFVVKRRPPPPTGPLPHPAGWKPPRPIGPPPRPVGWKPPRPIGPPPRPVGWKPPRPIGPPPPPPGWVPPPVDFPDLFDVLDEAPPPPPVEAVLEPVVDLAAVPAPVEQPATVPAQEDDSLTDIEGLWSDMSETEDDIPVQSKSFVFNGTEYATAEERAKASKTAAELLLANTKLHRLRQKRRAEQNHLEAKVRLAKTKERIRTVQERIRANHARAKSIRAANIEEERVAREAAGAAERVWDLPENRISDDDAADDAPVVDEPALVEEVYGDHLNLEVYEDPDKNPLAGYPMHLSGDEDDEEDHIIPIKGTRRYAELYTHLYNKFKSSVPRYVTREDIAESFNLYDEGHPGLEHGTWVPSLRDLMRMYRYDDFRFEESDELDRHFATGHSVKAIAGPRGHEGPRRGYRYPDPPYFGAFDSD